MRYWISTTGADLTNAYQNVSGGWEFVTSGYGQDGDYFERYEADTDKPAAFERLLDSDGTVVTYGACVTSDEVDY